MLCVLCNGFVVCGVFVVVWMISCCCVCVLLCSCGCVWYVGVVLRFLFPCFGLYVFFCLRSGSCALLLCSLVLVFVL